jgi:hypothetical protein
VVRLLLLLLLLGPVWGAPRLGLLPRRWAVWGTAGALLLWGVAPGLLLLLLLTGPVVLALLLWAWLWGSTATGRLPVTGPVGWCLWWCDRRHLQHNLLQQGGEASLNASLESSGHLVGCHDSMGGCAGLLSLLLLLLIAMHGLSGEDLSILHGSISCSRSSICTSWRWWWRLLGLWGGRSHC